LQPRDEKYMVNAITAASTCGKITGLVPSLPEFVVMSLKQQLSDLHDQLSKLESPDAETRQMLGVVLADISRLLHTNDSTESAVEKIDDVAARFDVNHPALSNALRQLVDALGKAGI
jgi:septal ring factor EnvC (AmiA/AmiB activator)